MPFPFRFICDLLQKLDDGSRSKKQQKASSITIVKEWFLEHRKLLDAPDTDAVAILSTLLPEKRTDRVYGIQVHRLEGIIGRAMCLGTTRLKQLREYDTTDLNKDLADCVEHILTRSPNPKQQEEITVEDIDSALHRIAASCRFSSKAVQASCGDKTQEPSVDYLAHFYTRLPARDAKWFSRLILKDYTPVVLNDELICKTYNPKLLQALNVRDDFAAALSLLHEDTASGPGNLIKLGVKVGRQPWLKARSIKHCADMINGRRISCEQKMDGEYCQIHIDLSKPPLFMIQIFSKSGKDSTRDREALHCAIRDSLKLGQRDCPVKKGCILEGELVAYSDKHQKIQPFHKIRKHVSRSGSFLGNIGDSQRHDHEHLMIIYYDLLMIDDISLLDTTQSKRFKQLEPLITVRKGHAELVRRQVIDFNKEDAQRRLKEAFAKCIVARGEGLVLKPDDPYFDFSRKPKHFASCAIKLKKEYLKGFGDVGDFAVVGASRDATAAKNSNIENLKYTHFFIACLDNPKEAQARTEKPRYIVTNVVTLNNTQLKYFKIYCNPAAIPLDENTYAELDFRGLGHSDRPTDVFPEPPIFDLYCFSFDKAPNSSMWTMRFPQVSKIHHDRYNLQVLSFKKLQEVTRDATEAPEVEDSQEMRLWLSKIEKADPEKEPVDYDSQITVSTVLTESTISTVGSDRPSTDNHVRKSGKSPAIMEDTPAATTSQRGLITPPRSSAVNSANTVGTASVSSVPNTRSGGRKRASPSAAKASLSKRPRTQTAATTGLPPKDNKASTRKRKPLDLRDANDPQRTTRSCSSISPFRHAEELDTMPLADEQLPSSVNGSFHTANEPTSSPASRTPQEKTGEAVAISIETAASREVDNCGHTRKKSVCAFANYTFLLSPCISRYAWIQDLLRGHGVLDFAVDPAAWAAQPPTASSSAAITPRSGSSILELARGGGKPIARRICLVEARRLGPTNDFTKEIEAAELKRRNGQRDWVLVYDWRILEDITKIESEAPEKGLDPWRSRYVGLA